MIKVVPFLYSSEMWVFYLLIVGYCIGYNRCRDGWAVSKSGEGKV